MKEVQVKKVRRNLVVLIVIAGVTAAAAAFALVMAVPALASAQRAGTLAVTEDCSQYDGTAGSFCTIASSNLDAIPAGSTLVATSAKGAGVLDSDLVLYTRGANAAYGHVVLDLATGTGTATFSGGTGQFKKFSASVAVSHLGGRNFGWSGSYSY
jgi:hypothetical protein